MGDLPVVVGNELTLTPETSGEVTGDQTGLIDLELVTDTNQFRTIPTTEHTIATYPVQRRGSRRRACAVAASHVDHDGTDCVGPLAVDTYVFFSSATNGCAMR